MDTTKKGILLFTVKRIFRSLTLTVASFAAYEIFMSGIASLTVYDDIGKGVALFIRIAIFFILPVVLFAYCICFSLYDEDSKHRYLVYLKESGEESSSKTNSEFFKKFKFRYPDYIVLALMWIVFLPGYISGAFNISLGWHSPLLSFVIAILFCALLLLSYYLSAVCGASFWANEFYSHRYSEYKVYKIISWKGVFNVGIILLDIYLLVRVVPVIIAYLLSSFVLVTKYIKLFSCLILAVWLLFYLRERRKRHFFMKELKDICNVNRADIKIYPAAHFIYLSGRRAVTVKTRFETFDIYFLPSMFRTNEIRIYDGFKFNKIFRFDMRSRGKFTLLFPVSFKKKVHFKGEHTEIIVANPVPKSIAVKERGIKQARYLHSADKIWGVGVYSGEAFRAAFDRKCRGIQDI